MSAPIAAYLEAKRMYLFTDDENSTERASDKAKIMVTDSRNRDDQYSVQVYGIELINGEHPLISTGKSVRLSLRSLISHDTKGIAVLTNTGEVFIPDTKIGSLNFARIQENRVA